NKTWKELVEQRYIVAGSPATVRQQLEELARSLRVGHLAIGGHIGSSPIELTNRSTFLLATQVLPHLRPIWSEYEDRWSPKPLPPGFGQSAGLEHIEDQLDLVLHCFDVTEALDLQRPFVVGESMGGWIAAEMAALRPREIGRLALAAPVGLWRDEAPVPDMFGMMPHELVPYLLHDQSGPAAQAMHAVTNLFSDKDDRTQEQVEFLISLVRGFRTAA